MLQHPPHRTPIEIKDKASKCMITHSPIQSAVVNAKNKKPLEMFGKHARRPDGLRDTCKRCLLSPSTIEAEQDRATWPDEHKRCTKCKLIKPLNMFAKHKRASGGRKPHCKDCVREYQQANADHISEYQKNYREENEDRLRQQKHEHYINNPEIYQQRNTSDKKRERDRLRRLVNREEYLLWRRAHRAANLDKLRAQDRAWREANPEKCRQNEEKYKASNLEKIRQRKRADRRANPEKHLISHHNRQARIKFIGGYFTTKDLANIRHIQGGKCAYCGRLGQKLTIEHIIATTRKGSSNDPWNICYACSKCNCSKKDKLLEEWTDRWYLR